MVFVGEGLCISGCAQLGFCALLGLCSQLVFCAQLGLGTIGVVHNWGCAQLGFLCFVHNWGFGDLCTIGVLCTIGCASGKTALVF